MAGDAADLLARVVPDGAVAVEATLADWDAPLHPDEAALVEGAVAPRRRELAAGRACARRALAALGVAAPPALLADDQRVPRWPAGVVGSISHTRAWCGAVVAEAARYRGVGLDGEHPLVGERAEVIALMCTAGELAWLARHAARRPQLGALLFAAKEAAYKCAFPTQRRLLEFHEVEIEVGDGLARPHGALAARLPAEGGPLRIAARFAVADELAVVCAAWPRAPSAP
jgi:4'-phosphopantetheinyl transferase EntD